MRFLVSPRWGLVLGFVWEVGRRSGLDCPGLGGLRGAWWKQHVKADLKTKLILKPKNGNG
jgi:hypothetical protein